MKTYVLTFISSAFLLGTLHAQDDNISERNLQVEKNYSDEIYAVHPVFDFGNIQLADITIPQMVSDSLIGSPIYAPDLDVQIQPLAYSVNSISAGHRAMLKIDKATINPWHIQAGYVFSKPNHFNVDANIAYDQWQSLDIEDQYTREIAGSIGMNYYLTHAVKTRIAFDYADNSYGLYGFQGVDSEVRNSSVNYNNYGMSFGVSTFRSTPAKLNGSLDIHMNQWKDKQTENRESKIDIRSSVNYRISDGFKLDFTPSLSFSNSETYLNGRIWNNSLTGTFDHSTWVAEIGISAAQAQSKWSLWPKVDANIHFSKVDKLELFAGQILNFWGAQELTDVNPYLSLISLRELNTTFSMDNKLIEISKNVGLNYSSTRFDKLELTLSASYQKNYNSSNYTIGGHKDLLQISSVDYDQLTMGLRSHYSLANDHIIAGVGIQYNEFIKSNNILYHRPNWNIEPSISTNWLENKLTLTLRANINDPLNIQDSNGVMILSSWRTDLGFNVRYRLFDQLSIYANADNVLDSKHQVWSGYQNYGRNLSVGILLKF